MNEIFEAALVNVDVAGALDREDELLGQLECLVFAEVKPILEDPEEVFL